MPHNNPHDKYKKAATQQEFSDEDSTDLPFNMEDDEIGNIIPPKLPDNLNDLCQEHVCPHCTQKVDADQYRLRALAEMENFKKRLGREHEDQLAYAAERVLTDILPSLDNLDLALQYGSKDEACKDMLMGVEMTHKLLLEAIKKHGLEPIGNVGDEFTPELHEALSFEERNDMEAGLVSTLMQRGYKLKDRLLRPAKVCISKKP